MAKINFDDFILTVDGALTPFVTQLHQKLTEGGCTIDIKEAKSGYMVAYSYNKKTLVNYVFRKKGIFARIYAMHIAEYMELLDTMPTAMTDEMKKAPVCKRLINPNDCNSRCPMGYDYILHGERQQKCRNSAFMFLLNEENNPHIEVFLLKELLHRTKSE